MALGTSFPYPLPGSPGSGLAVDPRELGVLVWGSWAEGGSSRLLPPCALLRRHRLKGRMRMNSSSRSWNTTWLIRSPCPRKLWPSAKGWVSPLKLGARTTAYRGAGVQVVPCTRMLRLGWGRGSGCQTPPLVHWPLCEQGKDLLPPRGKGAFFWFTRKHHGGLPAIARCCWLGSRL